MTTKINQDRKCFLDLPAELRNRIYHKVLVTEAEPIRIFPIWYDDRGCHKLSTSHSNDTIAMLQSCKAVHAEATPTLYGLNRFDLRHDFELLFLESIGSSVKYLRDVKVPAPYNKVERQQILNRMEQAAQLQRLHVHWDFFGSMKSMIEMAKLLRPLMEVLDRRALRTGGRAALSILELDEWGGGFERADQLRAIVRALLAK